jgi:hypothetical protein
VENNLPVVIRGAALQSPALHKWHNDAALVAEYGDLRVKLETKKEKDARSRVVGAEGGLGRSSLRTWFASLAAQDTCVFCHHNFVCLPARNLLVDRAVFPRCIGVTIRPRSPHAAAPTSPSYALTHVTPCDVV